MSTKFLSCLGLAAALAAPLFATPEDLKADAATALASVSAPRPSDSCFGRGAVVRSTRDVLERAETAVAERADDADKRKGFDSREAAAYVRRELPEGADACVAKTVLTYLSERGSLDPNLLLDDDGQSLRLYVRSGEGQLALVLGNSAGARVFALQVLEQRFRVVGREPELPQRPDRDLGALPPPRD